MLEHVSSFKLLGVYMAEDLTWAVHCDFRKPTEDCTRSGRSGAAVPASDTILVYTSPVRSILQYAYVMFSNLPLYLSDAIKKIEKPHFKLFFLRYHIMKP